MKYTELKKIYENFSILDNLKGAKFWLNLYKIKNQMDEEVKNLNAAMIKIEGLKEFDNERLQACEKFCDKDEKGESAKVEGSYKFNDKANRKEFESVMSGLFEKYAQSFAQKQELLEQEVKTEFCKINEDVIPDDISGEQFEIIKYFI